MNLLILLRLLCAHVLSDFVFQPDRLCNGKKRIGYAKFKYLFIHSLIYASVSYLFVAEWENFIIPSILFVSHFVVDFIKSSYAKAGIVSFLADQLVHIIVIVIVWLFFYCNADLTLIELYFNDVEFWCLCISYLLMLKPASVVVSLFINRWAPDYAASQGLPNAGKWIGYFERVLILTFIITDNIEGVGFLLAAKSIFRFGELNKAKEIKITEYMLIGTLVSFSIAFISGVVVESLVG